MERPIKGDFMKISNTVIISLVGFLWNFSQICLANSDSWSRATSKLVYRTGTLSRTASAIWVDRSSAERADLHLCDTDAVLLTANPALPGAAINSVVSVYLSKFDESFDESFLLEIQPRIKARD